MTRGFASIPHRGVDNGAPHLVVGVIFQQVDHQRESYAVPANLDRVRVAASLTVREREVLGLLAAGRTDGEIAAELFISKKTASVHVANIKGKLGATSRVEMAVLAARLDLVRRTCSSPGTRALLSSRFAAASATQTTCPSA